MGRPESAQVRWCPGSDLAKRCGRVRYRASTLLREIQPRDCHFAGLEKDKAKQLRERRSARKLLTKTSFLLHIALLTVAWAILLMLIRAATRVSRTFSTVEPN